MAARGVLYFLCLALSSGVCGQDVTETKLTASDGGRNDRFGSSVSISNGIALVGAPYGDKSSCSCGKAYIFERDAGGNWAQVQKLTASDADNQEYFGISVSISGDYAVIGAWGDNDNGSNSGSAYVFERDGAGFWSEVQKLIASDGAGGDYFGDSVSISGNYAVISARGDDDNGEASGSAYVFERDNAGNWIENAKLTASDGAADDLFGYNLSISGDYAMIGTPRDDDNGEQSGSVYAFERDVSGNWIEVQKLTASDGAEGDYFADVSISGDYAVIGAAGDDLGSGSAYVFERDRGDNWLEVAKLAASDGAGDDLFGWSVSISGYRAVIGAWGDDDGVTDCGSAYIFERDGFGSWGEVVKLNASDRAEEDHFGLSVAISGNDALIGAHFDEDLGERAGSAYVYTRCQGDATGDLVVNLADFSQLLVDFGSTDGSAADFNNDNIVDLADFSILLVNYGNECN